MARLYLFGEGQTEITFADTVLKPHLAQFGVYLDKKVQIAHARKKGKVHRGGGRSYQPMKDDIQRFLKQDQSGEVFFTTMIDLYAIHPGFPGLEDAEGLRLSPQDRVRALEKSFAEDIGSNRFIPYIQLHEYEAYLFSDPSHFEYCYDDSKKQIATLEAIAARYDTPELIDDGVNSAPSKRIIQQFPDYEDAKSVVGPEVAALIGLDKIKAKCPHFAEWVGRLEKLARIPHERG